MKELLKTILNLIFVILNIPGLFFYYLLLPLSRNNEHFAGFSQFYSMFPGQYGVYLRRNFYRFTMAGFGKDIVIGFGTLFSQQSTRIGDNVYIGPQCNIGYCEIAAECLIGSGVHILSGKRQHNFQDPTKPLREQGGIYSKVSIGENCWIGNQAIIMESIGDRCVVAAGATVTVAVGSRQLVQNASEVVQTPIRYKITES